ncbi:hypothetical protein HC031_05360 [Planosporangium thailandense]|uniref:Uncharacterized protein n=1 Tax=Planosporangium thailandense TaxID=765197 RepID=A0ABX0XT42_9ACTN|nr:hypothetical protein [Planosporangium thailandense]NJC69148.1 hypothetical protein [Planosporangium thailandense]
MNAHKSPLIDRRAAEHLLDQVRAGARPSHPPLAALLAAAAVPGRPEELACEPSIATAFRTAPAIPAPRPGRLSVIKSAVAKVLTVKVMAILATTTAGGVALAAGTGTLPNPLSEPAPSTHAGLSAAHPDASESGAAHRSAAPNASKDADDRSDAKGPDASKAPSPSLVGLCHAYAAGNKADHGKALENPAFTVLITAAGGKDKVNLYCTALLAAPTPATSADAGNGKSGQGHPTGRPSSAPTDHGSRPASSAKH